MKKIILFFALLIPTMIFAQKNVPAKPMTIFGVPLGTSPTEFDAAAKPINDALPSLLGVHNAHIFKNMYDFGYNNNIVWQAFFKASEKYEAKPGAAYSKVFAILSSKYGTPQNAINEEGQPALRWNLKNGFIQIWFEAKSEYGDRINVFYMQVVDYAAMKKALPELHKMM